MNSEEIINLSNELGIDKQKVAGCVNELVYNFHKMQCVGAITSAPTDVLKNLYKQVAEELWKREDKDRGEKLNQIIAWMRTILISKHEGQYCPIKNTTRQECFEVLYNIQDLLGTNRIC